MTGVMQNSNYKSCFIYMLIGLEQIKNLFIFIFEEKSESGF